ncbi:SMP-30/gluconolactonase/LRE family protein [Halomonas sp. ML-15]|uniref:SMP-30/gluconolactonase/LRE family protein n=1 Tax=Halomonas sp. ML-15 TaxID=2773305 RepID=UPI0017471B0C|nr:SMP-30/gluconolactonase/LRE family protein [Halomonas sp. ML-15]MBD3895997.1 SMP-30/gluconolactonase/LRE family protein [Halomonas sp. ML-15]
MVEATAIECVWEGRALLGAAPLWCPERGDAGQLLFVDTLASRRYAYDLASGKTHSWALDETCCGLARVAGGSARSPDGATLYRSDTPAGVIHAFDLDAQGNPARQREHIRFPSTQGYPDGMACDREGGLWVAHWEGGRISRFLPDGRLDETLTLSASRVTACAFGGAELDQLFITTAATGRDDETAAGGLFRCRPGVAGLSVAEYASDVILPDAI